MYRGMHHPIDASAGVLIGLALDRDRAVRDAGRRRGGARSAPRRAAGMKRVAVIAHSGKTLGGGLPELRRVLAERGVTDVFWREVREEQASRPSRSRRRSSTRPT